MLFDSEKIDLPKFHKHSERVDFVMGNILNTEPYCYYYNPFNEDVNTLSEDDQKRLNDRWLGVKVVGKTDADESLKHFIDFLSGYILRADEFDVRPMRKRYLELVQMESYTEGERSEKEEIGKRVIYEDIDRYNIDNSIVFVENEAAEVNMKKRLNELSGSDGKDYSTSFIYSDLEKRIDKCGEIKEKVLDLSSQIGYNVRQIVEIRKSIKDNSSSSKITSNDVDTVLGDVRELKRREVAIRDCKYKIEELYQEYLSYTELFTAAV